MLGEWKVSEQVREAETRKRDVEIFWTLFFLFQLLEAGSVAGHIFH